MAELEAQKLRELLDYDAETGKLTWLARPREMFASDLHFKGWNTRFAGTAAFTAIGPTGYRRGAVFNRSYQAHRVIWAWVHGEWPTQQIDHINGVRDDNRLANLRSVTISGNSRNVKLHKSNTSGVCGVSWIGRDRRWAAQIHIHGKHVHLGYFKNKEDAITARKEGERLYDFHPNHGRAA